MICLLRQAVAAAAIRFEGLTGAKGQGDLSVERASPRGSCIVLRCILAISRTPHNMLPCAGVGRIRASKSSEHEEARCGQTVSFAGVKRAPEVFICSLRACRLWIGSRSASGS